MRELIRPALFMIARAGLLASVVAAIAGQWWTISILAPCPWYNCEVLVAAEGLIGAAYPEPVDWTFDVSPNSATDTPTGGFIPQATDHFRNLQGSVFQDIPGLRLIILPSLELAMTIVRHWFIISVLTAINIALHFFYRQHPEMPPCES